MNTSRPGRGQHVRLFYTESTNFEDVQYQGVGVPRRRHGPLIPPCSSYRYFGNFIKNLRLVDLYPTVAMSTTGSFDLLARQHLNHFVTEDLDPRWGLVPFCRSSPFLHAYILGSNGEGSRIPADVGVTFVLSDARPFHPDRRREVLGPLDREPEGSTYVIWSSCGPD